MTLIIFSYATYLLWEKNLGLLSSTLFYSRNTVTKVTDASKADESLDTFVFFCMQKKGENGISIRLKPWFS